MIVLGHVGTIENRVIFYNPDRQFGPTSPIENPLGLVLRFERQSAHGYRDFEWRTKPLGLVFSDSMPMTVAEVHEEAEHMGVRVGDVLKGYGREWDLVGGPEWVVGVEGNDSGEMLGIFSEIFG